MRVYEVIKVENKQVGIKAFVFVLLAAFLALVIVGGFFAWRLLAVKGFAASLETRLEDAYGAEGQSPWLTAQESDLNQLAAKTASGYDQMFRRLEGDVKVCAGFMNQVLSNPENFSGRNIGLPASGQEGTFSIRAVVAAAGDEKTPQNINELRIISNIEYIFAPALIANTDIKSLSYTVEESGVSAVFIDTNAYPDSFDFRKTDWYKAALAGSGKVVWSGPAEGADKNKTLVVTAATTVKKPDGNSSGVVAGNLGLSALLTPLEGLDVGQKGGAWIADGDGNRITATGMGANLSDGAEANHQEALERLFAGESGGALVTIDGKEKVFSFVPLANGFYLGLYRDVAELHAAGDGDSALQQAAANVGRDMDAMVQNSLLLGGMVAGAVLLLMVLLAFLMSRSIVNGIVPFVVASKGAVPPVPPLEKKKKKERLEPPEQPEKKEKKEKPKAAQRLWRPSPRRRLENENGEADAPVPSGEDAAREAATGAAEATQPSAAETETGEPAAATENAAPGHNGSGEISAEKAGSLPANGKRHWKPTPATRTKM